MATTFKKFKVLVKAIRCNKRSLVLRLAILGAAVLVTLALLVLFRAPVGIDKVIELTTEALGESVAEAIE